MYIVIENTPGYLPDIGPTIFDSWTHAWDYALSLANELEADGYVCARPDANDTGDNVIACTTADDLRRVIEVTEL